MTVLVSSWYFASKNVTSQFLLQRKLYHGWTLASSLVSEYSTLVVMVNISFQVVGFASWLGWLHGTSANWICQCGSCKKWHWPVWQFWRHRQKIQFTPATAPTSWWVHYWFCLSFPCNVLSAYKFSFPYKRLLRLYQHVI